jgi:DNA-binding MurR/RpiR family transcriptional regulator
MSKFKLYESFLWLRKKYVVERLTEEQIAELAGTSQATINRWLVKHNLKKKRT